LVTAGIGLLVLLALVGQILARPGDLGLLLTVCEVAGGAGLLITGFALMVVGADPFDDADGATGDRISAN
jgi:hypothetical protein